MILERIKEYIDYKGLSIASFERSIGMANASFGKSLKNKGAIGTDKLEKILSIYPDISPTWLLTGIGEMLKTKCISMQQNSNYPTDSIDKDNNSLSNSQTLGTDILDKLFQSIAAKDSKIEEQASEIGRLQELIRQMKIEKGKVASDATTSGTANAG